MTITLPAFSLVVLVGATSCGKSSFARRHFLPTEVVSSDACRGLVADDESVLDANDDAFHVLHAIAATRLRRGRLTVIDATNLQPEARGPLVALAREHDVLPVAIVFQVDERTLMERNRSRPERNLPPHVIRGHVAQLRRSLRSLEREGFRHVFALRSVDEIDAATIERQPLWNDRRDDHGPFDIIGDVHGCADELELLLTRLGYTPDDGAHRHPEGRRAVFLGDLVDRGPDTPGVLRTAMAMHAAGSALCVPGNHDMKLLRALRGRRVQVTHGLAQSLEQLGREPDDFRTAVGAWIDSLVSHYVLDDGRLVVAHAGMKEPLQGRASGRVRQFALYGETTGETDEFGLPVRYDWASDYRGRAMVVYGHTPVAEPEWVNGTICIDTGCVFGGRLTALRYPERELVSVAAQQTYYEPARPFLPDGGAPLPPRRDEVVLLDIADVSGRRAVATELSGNVTVAEAQAAAALEAMSRFAVDPRWLIYLPPTMSPTETSSLPGYLEHPLEAFAYFRTHGVARVVCEEKHMGSRAVLVVCRDEATAVRRFRIAGDGSGICYTRTGRRFFDAPAVEAALLDRVRSAASDAGLWEELDTDWLCLDAELMPWSAKAGELLRTQYAPVAAAAGRSLRAAEAAAELTQARGIEVAGVLERLRSHTRRIDAYAKAYGAYCWEVAGSDDLRLGVFHVLASERGVHVDRDHLWHTDVGARLAAVGGPVLTATEHRSVDVTDPESVDSAVAWWTERTEAGSEGVVVKPLGFTVRGPRGLVQPGIKCRGREYLRIIYGPEYDREDNLTILRSRSLRTKRSLAQREFALGVEALHRFARNEPLYRVHECVFAVLALESEPVDPRL